MYPSSVTTELSQIQAWPLTGETDAGCPRFYGETLGNLHVLDEWGAKNCPCLMFRVSCPVGAAKGDGVTERLSDGVTGRAVRRETGEGSAADGVPHGGVIRRGCGTAKVAECGPLGDRALPKGA